MRVFIAIKDAVPVICTSSKTRLSSVLGFHKRHLGRVKFPYTTRSGITVHEMELQSFSRKKKDSSDDFVIKDDLL